MTDIIRTLRSRPPRYDIKDDSGLTVRIEKEDASCESIEVKLLNISTGGAKIKTREIILAQDVLELTIQAEDPKRVIAVSGDVCWVAPAAGDDWSLGCKFAPPIPDEVLHEFAESGILERREHDRKRVSMRTSAQWELRSGTMPVRIINYSRGGFCLFSQTDGKPGERTLLQLETDEDRTVVIPGKIKWQVESDEGFVIGCEFLDAQDYAVLCQLLDPIPQVNSSGSSPKPGLQGCPSPRLIAGCAAGVLCLATVGALSLSTGPAAEPPGLAHSEDTTETRAWTHKTSHAVRAEEPSSSAREGNPAAARIPFWEDTFQEVEHLISELGGNGDLSRGTLLALTEGTGEGRGEGRGEGEFPWELTPAGLAGGTTRPGDAPLRGETSPGETRNSERSRAGTSARVESWSSVGGGTAADPPLSRESLSRGTSRVADASGAWTRPAAASTTTGDDPQDGLSDRRAEVEPRGPQAPPPDPVQVAPPGSPADPATGGPNEPTPTRPSAYRNWTDDTGRYRVLARLEKVEGNVVRLRKDNGRYASVPLDRLSPRDVQYIRRWLDQRP